MFKIGIKLAGGMGLNGLKALDWRRLMGLPDRGYVRFAGYGYRRELKADVDESFARKHFARADTVYEEVSLNPDDLKAGDLEEVLLSGTGEFVVDLPADMPTARVIGLWLDQKERWRREDQANQVAELRQRAENAEDRLRHWRQWFGELEDILDAVPSGSVPQALLGHIKPPEGGQGGW